MIFFRCLSAQFKFKRYTKFQTNKKHEISNVKRSKIEGVEVKFWSILIKTRKRKKRSKRKKKRKKSFRKKNRCFSSFPPRMQFVCCWMSANMILYVYPLACALCKYVHMCVSAYKHAMTFGKWVSHTRRIHSQRYELQVHGRKQLGRCHWHCTAKIVITDGKNDPLVLL